MEVQLIGHATVLLKDQDFSFICDPWLKGGSVNNAMVWQYPPRIRNIEDFSDFRYMYISHHHEDHCNLDTLSLINKKTPIFLLDFKENQDLKNNLNKLGFFNLNIIQPWKKNLIDKNTSITIFPADTEFADSSALIEYKNLAMYHGNDNILNEKTLAKISLLAKIDIAFLPYVGFSGYPACYEFDQELKRKLGQKKKRERMEGFYNSVKILNPKKAVPAAGDLILVGNGNEWVNFFDKPTTKELKNNAPDLIKEKILLMGPDDVYNFSSGYIPAKNKINWTTKIEDQKKFGNLPDVKTKIDSYCSWLYNISTKKFESLVFDYFNNGILKFENTAKKVGDYIFTLSSRNEKSMNADITIKFNDLKITKLHAENYSKKISLDPEIMCRIIRKEMLWSDAFSSMFLKIDRRPYDNYNRTFWAWLENLNSLKFNYKEYF